MHFSTALFSVMALLAANQVIGASVEVPRDVGAILIATSPCWFPLIRQYEDIVLISRAVYACNCPNNCKHKQGSSCKYYSGPSDKSKVISGSKYLVTTISTSIEVTNQP
jgi:hypothetical protein